jgi:hypothetical protein
MRTLAWTCLWPGLTALWVRGRWSGLATATAFAATLNFALVATLAGDVLYGTVLSGWPTMAAAWTSVLGFWVLGVRRSLGELSGRPESQTAQSDDLLREAQTQYLRAHWIEAETLLARLLATRPNDVEARLLLATIQRRTGRTAEAKALLTELKSDPAAAGWRWEIEDELAALNGRQEVGGIERKAA